MTTQMPLRTQLSALAMLGSAAALLTGGAGLHATHQVADAMQSSTGQGSSRRATAPRRTVKQRGASR